MNLEFLDRLISLPEYRSRKAINCGFIDQVILPKGEYRVVSSRDISPKASIIDLADCPFKTIFLQQGKKPRVKNFDSPSAITDDASAPLIKAKFNIATSPDAYTSTSDKVISSWNNALRLTREIVGVSEGFRNAQVGAIYAVLAHWSVSEQPCTVVLPTGTGKTETMLGITVSEKAKLVVVVVPTDDLRGQLSEKFKELGLLKKIGVLSKTALLPKVATLTSGLTDEKDLDALLSCNVIISTPLILTRNRALFEKLATHVSHVFFDESHHLKAPSWESLKKGFNSARIVQFTATPYRLDRQPIDGKVVYQYSLEHAQRDGCFSEISLIAVDERNPNKKDPAIANAAYERLVADRDSGYTNHRMMVRAANRGRAEELFQLYARLFPAERVVKIYSDAPRKKEKIEALKRGEYDIVVCVDMLREGFDFPEFKIAAVHDIHKSLAVAMQFIGRFIRQRTDLGRAHMVINYAEADIPQELEKLYAEGTGWDKVIAEVAQSKQQEAIEFINFLSGCQPFRSFDDPDQTISPRLVNPALSCVVYRCNGVNWSRFHKAFPDSYRFSQPYEHLLHNLFYFSAQTREPVKWTRSEAIRDQRWTLVIMHFAEDQGLLYIGCSDKKFKHENLAKAICNEDYAAISGNFVFRCFQNIKRLKIIHAGLLKPANRNHRYSKYSGADVTTQLESLQNGGRARKSDFVGIGYRDGQPVGVGASQKGKVWNPARVGNPMEWIEWCRMTGALLIDETIDPNEIFKDTAKVKALDRFPIDVRVIAVDWNEETFEKYHRLTLVDQDNISTPLYLCEFADWSYGDTKFQFTILRANLAPISVIVELKGEDGHTVVIPSSAKIMVSGWKHADEPLQQFFLDYPPTLFLADGSIISGCQQTEFHFPCTSLPSDFFEPWSWGGVDITLESAFKSVDGQLHFISNSIQQRVMEDCRNKGAVLVFNDDGSGESADIVAVFESDDLITFKLFHCKYSLDPKPGHRVDDLYQVCGQAVKSVKWKWDPKALMRHLKDRTSRGQLLNRRFFHGGADVITDLNKKLDYTDVRFEFWIVQPGLFSQGVPNDLITLLMASVATISDMTECRLRFISS